MEGIKDPTLTLAINYARDLTALDFVSLASITGQAYFLNTFTKDTATLSAPPIPKEGWKMDAFLTMTTIHHRIQVFIRI